MWASRRKNNKKRTHYNYFVLPTPVSLPQFPVPKELFPVVTRDLKPYPGISEKSMQYIRVLESIRSAESLQVNEKNHLQILKLMLYVEEIQNNLDMKRYDQHEKTVIRISAQSDLFKIYVQGLMEDRPSVRPQDIVEIRDPQTRTLFLLRVTNVMNDHLITMGSKRFCQEFVPSKFYNISFRYQNYTIRCSHYALTLVNLFKLTPYFFPLKRPAYSKEFSDQTWFNKTIEENPEQKQAVLNIACKSCYPAPYILYGPPGTGKTSTLVEAICQVWQNNPSEHILVCTPSNSAADVITKRLLKYIPDNHLYRMYSPSKEGSQIDEEIVGCSNYVDGQVMMLPREIVVLKSIVISTLCACTRLLFLDLREKHFSYVFIDEAGQAIEPDAMIPFNLLSSTKEGRIGRLHGQVIIAGDPQQLGPGVRSKIAEPVLAKSMLERLMELEPYRKNEHDRYNPSYITKLLRNYRSHPEIIRVSNELFYDNELLCFGGENIRKAEGWSHLVRPLFPIVFHGVKGTEEKDYKSPSVYNLDEIKVVLHYVRLLLGNGLKGHTVTQSDIGIVTPFVAQRIRIHKALEEQNLRDIEVGTVELFQGQEKDIIIMSAVRTLKFYHNNEYHIGFLSNPKRFNVALTRARALLIVVGDPTVLKTDIHWCYFLNFCKKNKACRGVQFFIERDIENEVKKLQFNKQKKVDLSLLNDSNMNLVQLDDGVIESSDESMIDENEYPSTSFNKINNHKSPTGPRSESLLSDIIMQKMKDMEIAKASAKERKKNKKKKNTES